MLHTTKIYNLSRRVILLGDCGTGDQNHHVKAGDSLSMDQTQHSISLRSAVHLLHAIIIKVQ